MIEKVLNSLNIQIPEVSREPISEDLPVINANPHCGPLPLVDIEAYWDTDYMNLKGMLSSKYVQFQIMPRGRPHFALIDLALINDNLATLCFLLYTGKTYGKNYRYVQISTIAAFKQEAFIRGSLNQIPSGAIEVDSFEMQCELIKRKPKRSLDVRGIYRVTIVGISGRDRISVACWEGEYFRRKGVLNIKAA